MVWYVLIVFDVSFATDSINGNSIKFNFILTLGVPSYFLPHRLPRGLPPPRFSVWFKILYRVIQRLVQHCFLSIMVYLHIKYVIDTRNYDFLISALVRNERTPMLFYRNSYRCWINKYAIVCVSK